MNDTQTPDQGCRNLRWALALFDGLVRSGLRHLVLSPGSRSTPLILAAQRHPCIDLKPILDERSAAFFALGLAQASSRPVGLVCTSGSALAHWLPAVIEASESGFPLILLSADRPPELRGWGANQTIDQTRMFGSFAREFHDPGPAGAGPAALKAIRALGMRAGIVSLGPRPGPVHINLPFREPLVPGPSCDAEAEPEPGRAQREALAPLVAVVPRTPSAWPHGLVTLFEGRGVICCGPMMLSNESAAAIWRCAEILHAPVLADPLSGLRFGPASAHRITRYDSLLRNAAAATGLKPDWVLRFGGTPVSKTLLSWLDGVPAILVDPSERWNDPGHDVCARVATGPVDFCQWLQASRVGDLPTREPDSAGQGDGPMPSSHSIGSPGRSWRRHPGSRVI
jgi:2-succinyl-5-enolpyruvyl-6-hydroxy-3-cyclohexene-1-carboxylate synthase